MRMPMDHRGHVVAEIDISVPIIIVDAITLRVVSIERIGLEPVDRPRVPGGNEFLRLLIVNERFSRLLLVSVDNILF
jgi:hypothetical protein